MDDCVVCRGRQTIRLPIWRPVMVMPDDAVPDVTDSSREYPCPECVAKIPYERLAAVTFVVPAYPQSPAASAGELYAAKQSMARALGDKLFEDGLIAYEVGEPSDYHRTIPIKATVGVVAPTIVAEFEERVAARQFEVANKIIAETRAQIANWGSFYGGDRVYKDQANEWLTEALKRTKEKFGDKPDAPRRK